MKPTEPTTAPPPEAGPHGPGALDKRSWLRILRRTVRQFGDDKLDVWAAALTYYAMLSLFPGLLVVTAMAGLVSDRLMNDMLADVKPLMPGPVQEIVSSALRDVQSRPGHAGIAAVMGLAVALWSASGYISAFMQASNAIYDVPEGRPLWKRLPLRLGLTLATGLLLLLSISIVVFSGRVAEIVGRAAGLSSQAVAVWQVAKWPVLVLLVALLFALLYWASPNARQGGFRWVSPGGLLAVVLWIVVSAGFAFYAANFGSYTATYGALGGVVVFLIWLWLSNLAFLLGAEFNAELERERAIAAGHPEQREPYLRLRDDRGSKDQNPDL